MKIIDIIKSFLNRIKIKRLPETIDSGNVILLIKKEKNPENIKNILGNYISILTSSEIIDIVSKLLINDRMQTLLKYKEYVAPYDLSEFIIKKLDTERKIVALKEFQMQLDLYDIYNIFDTISPDRREEALDTIIDRFDGYAISEIIQKYIPFRQRKFILYKYEDVIDSISKVSIILKMPMEDKLEATEKYANEISKINMAEIVASFPEKNISDATIKFAKNMSIAQISDIIMYNVPENKRKETLINISEYLSSSIISDIIKYSLKNEDRKDAIIVLRDKLDEKHIAEIIQYFLKDDIELINMLKDKMDIEDVIYFKDAKAK